MSNFKGVKLALRDLSGAKAYRVLHPGGQHIPAHAHDLPFISIRRIGSYVEELETKTVVIDAPSVSIHPAGRAHADHVSAEGLETLSIEFDPAWVQAGLIGEPKVFIGGDLTRAAHRLASTWASGASEEVLQAGTSDFLGRALREPDSSVSSDEVLRVSRRFAAGELSASQASAMLGVSGAWFLRRFGEIYGETARQAGLRQKIEVAVQLLRTTDEALASVAGAADFYDQAHMTKAFRQVLGRTPSSVRRERTALAGLRSALDAR